MGMVEQINSVLQVDQPLAAETANNSSLEAAVKDVDSDPVAITNLLDKYSDALLGLVQSKLSGV